MTIDKKDKLATKIAGLLKGQTIFDAELILQRAFQAIKYSTPIGNNSQQVQKFFNPYNPALIVKKKRSNTKA